MRKVSVFLSLVAFIMGSQAVLGESIHFSTGGDQDMSWTVTVTNQVAVMSFNNNEVDTTSSSPDAALGDFVDLPTMTLANLQTMNISGVDLILATMVPDGSPLTIRADVASGTAAANEIVMSANITQGGYIAVGSNFIAFSDAQDDLNNVSCLSGYSDVLDSFAAADFAGFDVDLSFSGDASEALFTLLNELSNGSVSGTLSGQITAVPEPSILAMLSLGAGLFLLGRKRRAPGL